MDFDYSAGVFARNRDEVIAELSTDKRVLHVGAADSPYTEQKLEQGLLLHQRLSSVTSELHGIDIDPEAVEIVNKSGLARIQVRDINDLHMEDEQRFDVIIFGETIEHLVDLGSSLESLKRCMDNNSVLLISTPNLFSLDLFRMGARGKEHVHDDHKVGFSYGLLSQLLTSAGLDVELIYFTFLPRACDGYRKRIWTSLARWKPGLSETLLAVARLQGSASEPTSTTEQSLTLTQGLCADRVP